MHCSLLMWYKLVLNKLCNLRKLLFCVQLIIGLFALFFKCINNWYFLQAVLIQIKLLFAINDRPSFNLGCEATC